MATKKPIYPKKPLYDNRYFNADGTPKPGVKSKTPSNFSASKPSKGNTSTMKTKKTGQVRGY